MDRKTDGQLYGQTDRVSDGQTGRHNDRQIFTNRHQVTSELFFILGSIKDFLLDSHHLVFFHLRSLVTSVALQMMIIFAYLCFMIFCVRSFTTLNTWKRATFQSYKDNSRMFEYQLIKLLIYSTTKKDNSFFVPDFCMNRC